jgi:hypothetical protein
MFDSTHSIWLWIYLAASLAFVWAIFSIAARRRRHSPPLRDEQEEVPPVVHQQDRGVSTPLCIICERRPAKERLPEIGLSVFERMNPLRSLYAGVHLYRRVENPWADVCACPTCRDLYAGLMDEDLTEQRRMVAMCATSVDRRVTYLRSGGLVIAARQEQQEASRQLARAAGGGAYSPQLGPRVIVSQGEPTEDVAISVQQTTNGKPVEAETN